MNERCLNHIAEPFFSSHRRSAAARAGKPAAKKAAKFELTEEQKQEIREAFDLFDTDGSGALSPGYLATFIDDAAHRPRALAQAGERGDQIRTVRAAERTGVRRQIAGGTTVGAADTI